MAVIFGPTPWQFGTQVAAASLGTCFAGGFLICKSGGVGWIVAPSSTQVSRTWNCRNDAVTTAQANAPFGDWFVPTCTQFQNPGHTCRTYWDSYGGIFWVSTEYNANNAWNGNSTNGNLGVNLKTCPFTVRAFRCVTY